MVAERPRERLAAFERGAEIDEAVQVTFYDSRLGDSLESYDCDGTILL